MDKSLFQSYKQLTMEDQFIAASFVLLVGAAALYYVVAQRASSSSSSSLDAAFLSTLVRTVQLREKDLGGTAEAKKDFTRIFRSQSPSDGDASVFLVTDGDGAVPGAAVAPQPVIGTFERSSSGALDAREVEGARTAFRAALYGMLDARGLAPVHSLGLDCNSPQMCAFAAAVERQLTISAGMRVLEASCWFPMHAEFLQPRFVIVVSELAKCVKVVTYAYVGSGSRGDRPTTKHTDFICRIVTSNLLLSAAAANPGAAVKPKAVVATLSVDVERASRKSSLRIVADELGQLKSLAMYGAWPGSASTSGGSGGGGGGRGGGNLLSP